MFNHAVRFYDLPENPAAKAGNMGKEKCGEVLIWTKDEYLQFIETLKDKPASYYAFETLYWCGLRLGEMLALTPADFDFERKIIHVTKSFQRIKGEDIITPPKTEKGIRRVLMPDFYADKMQSYIESLQLNENDRIFPFTKSYMPFFKLIPELKFCFSMLDVLEKDRSDLRDENLKKFTESVDKAVSKMIVLSFYFE